MNPRGASRGYFVPYTQRLRANIVSVTYRRFLR
jgi:hypothetical protein